MKKIVIIFMMVCIAPTLHAAAYYDEPKPITIIREIMNETPLQIMALHLQKSYTLDPNNPTKYILLAKPLYTWHTIAPATATTITRYKTTIPLFSLSNSNDFLYIWKEGQNLPTSNNMGDKPITVIHPNLKQAGNNLSLKIVLNPHTKQIDVIPIFSIPIMEVEKTSTKTVTAANPLAEIFYKNTVVNRTSKPITVIKKDDLTDAIIAKYTIDAKSVKDIILSETEKISDRQWPHRLEFINLDDPDFPFWRHIPEDNEGSMAFLIKQRGHDDFTVQERILSAKELQKIKEELGGK
jgi:hypothetical protein